MHEIIARLKYETPPQSRSIDPTAKHWIRDALHDIWSKACELAASDPALRDVLTNTAYAVINYASVMNGGERHSFTLADKALFESLYGDQIRSAPARDDDTMRIGFIDKSAMKFVGTDDEEGSEPSASPARLRLQRVADAWRANWRAYLQIDEGNESFTLNELLLRHGASPQPINILWGGADGAPKYAPFTIPISGQSLVAIAANNRSGLSDVTVDALVEAARSFRLNFVRGSDLERRLYTENRSSEGVDLLWSMLQKLVSHFKLDGTGSFTSIPVMISTRHHPSPSGARRDNEELNRGLRAVVSFCMKEDADAETLENAWLFYNGLGNQVVSDILVYEYAYYLQSNWQESRRRIVYGMTHPTKNCFIRARKAARKAARMGADLMNREAFGGDERRMLTDELQRCVNHMDAAAGRMQLIHLNADLLEAMTSTNDIRRECARNSNDPERSLDLIRMIKDVSGKITDKSDTGIGVSVSAGSCPSILIPRRFTGPAFGKYREDEPDLIGHLFGELLENAASYGEPVEQGAADGAAVKTVDVRLAWEKQADGEFLIIINKIGPEMLLDPTLSEKYKNRGYSTYQESGVSGLSLSRHLLDLLDIASLETGVTRKGGDEAYWACRLRLRNYFITEEGKRTKWATGG